MDQEQIKSEIKQYINRLVDEKKCEIKTLSDKEIKKIQQSSRGYNSKEKDDGFTLVVKALVICAIASEVFELASQLIAIWGGK